jgi:hypothetical protein
MHARAPHVCAHEMWDMQQGMCGQDGLHIRRALESHDHTHSGCATLKSTVTCTTAPNFLRRQTRALVIEWLPGTAVSMVAHESTTCSFTWPTKERDVHQERGRCACVCVRVRVRMRVRVRVRACCVVSVGLSVERGRMRGARQTFDLN